MSIEAKILIELQEIKELLSEIKGGQPKNLHLKSPGSTKKVVPVSVDSVDWPMEILEQKED
ncbi:hypothetical protein KW794_00585 [Candidatus Saccharibacteria bacterium]|nr:hypothetical protein [Candidatus Saccharibacteria bacterium]